MRLPDFPYHPDPVATGSIVASSTPCRVCGQARGFIYVGPTYGRGEDLSEQICPWCIADGSAERLGVSFTDAGLERMEDVPGEVRRQIEHRTPGFTGWQQDHWLHHCGDGAAFLGLVGRKELEPYPDALEMLREEQAAYGRSPAEVAEYVDGLHRDGDATAYLFCCRRCGRHVAYSDLS